MHRHWTHYSFLTPKAIPDRSIQQLCKENDMSETMKTSSNPLPLFTAPGLKCIIYCYNYFEFVKLTL